MFKETVKKGFGVVKVIGKKTVDTASEFYNEHRDGILVAGGALACILYGAAAQRDHDRKHDLKMDEYRYEMEADDGNIYRWTFPEKLTDFQREYIRMKGGTDHSKTVETLKEMGLL